MELTHAAISPNAAIHGHSTIAWVGHSAGMTSARDLSRQRRVLEEKTQMIRQEFAEGDKESNLALDFEEFLAMQPKGIREQHSAEKIMEWFKAADSDGDDKPVSIMEFFKYSIGPASLEHGSAALDGVFKQFDKDGDGSLDFKELSDAADTIGMGGLANDILNAFMQTDRDRSGGITYGEMLEELRRASRADSRTILLLTTLIWGSESSKPEQSCKVLELAKTWRIKSRDAPALHAELQELLRDTGCHVADLLALFDHDALVARSVDDVEFLAGLKSFGYKGSAKVASDVFKMIDKSGDGQIGFDELFEFIRGRRHCLDRRNVQVRQMRLQPPPGVSSLENVVWDVETLRILLQQMLARYGVSIGELMSSWDRNGDFTVQRLEFLDGVRGFCSEYERVQLWEREVAKVAMEAFTRINASPRGRSDAMSRHRADVLNEAIECSELGRWLERPTLRPHSTQGAREEENRIHIDPSLITPRVRPAREPAWLRRRADTIRPSGLEGATFAAVAAVAAATAEALAKLSPMESLSKCALVEADDVEADDDSILGLGARQLDTARQLAPSG
ncbi:hypothetical protein Ctob_009998 [Chrysochromulina tobinii]|uniref:EF-hand domain-containing protein n=1 Tax=Chrysochromulina tobinii TaxID=1460289 RepID=A0A0M0K882_9EUKA|nr:hypothetical protein Ctob_009998 [Chrysochromulina tobinii]|eukprot:KOO35025.1 hypothetical protein Ctob_009998 [Chrysochromulina sp. CCMP291]